MFKLLSVVLLSVGLFSASGIAKANEPELAQCFAFINGKELVNGACLAEVSLYSKAHIIFYHVETQRPIAIMRILANNTFSISHMRNGKTTTVRNLARFDEDCYSSKDRLSGFCLKFYSSQK